MAQTLGGIAGAAIGSAFGPVGAQIGWAIGAAVGNSFTTIKQPRLGELAVVAAGEGGARARVYGSFRPLGGQIVWSGEPREIRTRQRSGKGGPKVESSTILRSYAIGICEGPITGVSRIWRNNELVYDVRPGSEILAESTEWLEGKTIALGDWDQLPHPTIEAEMGAGVAPAMRGTAMLVVTDEDLTDLRGAIPSYQFEIGGSASGLPPRYEAGTVTDPLPIGIIGQVSAFNVAQGVHPAPGDISDEYLVPVGANAVLYRFRNLAGPGDVAYRGFLDNVQVTPVYSVAPGTDLYVLVPATAGQRIALEGLNPLNPTFAVAFTYWKAILSFTSAGDALFGGGGFVPGDATPADLRSIAASICTDSGMSAPLFDVSALPDVLVPGFATSPDYSASEALRELAKVYFFDVSDADGKVVFVPRGGNFTAVLTDAEFVDGEDEPETDTTRDSISVPRLLHLSYFDEAGGQGTDKQFSERQISTRVESPTVLQTSVVLDAETAATAIRVQHQVMEEELRGELVFGISDQRIALAVADVIVVQYRGRSQRCRITKLEIMDGWQRITAVRDRQSAYTATVQAVPPAVVTRPPSTLVGATRFAFLDLPALGQAGDVLSYHIATSGEQAGWRGAVVEREEAGAQFGVLATDGDGTVMGTLTAALPQASEWYPDESNAILVQLARADDELEAVTTETWLGRANAAALVRADGTAEVIQFRDAAEVEPGIWRLTGLQRGRLNSGASAHAIGAVFVLLDGSLLVQAGSERLATTLTHRAYSAGSTPATATTQARTWSGRSQREWPPIIESAEVSSGTLSATWTPRHRFGSDETPVASQHFDGWQIDATAGATTVTALSALPSASLDVSALTPPITVTVRGRNRLAGLGDAATRIIP